MSLYAIGDLHLHFQSELKAQHQINGKIWQKHDKKFKKNCAKMLTDEDTLVLIGDHSWGKNLAESQKDLEYISDLPGRKIMIRGNHDMFWEVNKTKALNEKYAGKLLFLQNNYYPYKDYAIVGTKGFTFEGPFYLNMQGKIIGWSEDAEDHAKKIIAREEKRLRESFEAAHADGYEKFIMFLHYPPTSILESESVFTRMAEEYGAEHVVYAHSHGQHRFHDSLHGKHRGVKYHLASGDYLKWVPVKILS